MGVIVNASVVRVIRCGVIWSVASLLGFGYVMFEANAHSNGQGINGLTNKGGGNTGCYCHCASSSSSTTVTLNTSATAFYPNHSYTFTVTVANSSENGAGVEVAVENGSLTAGTGMQLGSGELTHTQPITSLPATWTFTYTTPSSAGPDTLFAVGNAVNLDGNDDCNDKWNFATKYFINVTSQPVTKAIALSRPSIPLGTIRVGRTAKDTMLIRSTSTNAITVNTSLNSGTQFSRYPTGSNRSIDAGSAELDSAIFTPTSRGSFSDSLIITSNVDNTTDQRKAVYVTGTGIAGVYSSSITSLGFGNLRLGQSKRLALVYSNTGDDTLFMQTPSLSGTGFSIAAGATKPNLPPNATDSIVVLFGPISKTSYSGSLTPSATGQSISSVTLSGNGVAPTISFISPDNIGGVRVNQSTQGTVTIDNSGTDTLHISSAALTSGATTKFSIASGPPLAISPSGQGSVTIGYTPNQEKFDTVIMTIHSDDASDSVAQIAIVAQGEEPHIFVDQTDTVDFGGVQINSTPATMDIAALNTGLAELNISSVTVSPLPFALASAPVTVDPGSDQQVVVSFTPTTVGAFTGTVTINSDDPRAPTVKVYVKGSGINSSLSVPSNVVFGAQPVGIERDTTVYLVNTGTVTTSIFKYTLTPDSSFGVTDSSRHSIAAGDSIPVGIKFNPVSASSYSGSLSILTNEGSAPTRTIALSGSGIKGSLGISTQSLNFGSIDSLTSKTDTVTICNTGNATVTVLGLNITGSSAYAAKAEATLPFVMQPGGCLNITVTFDPPHSGAAIGALQIQTKEVSSVSVSLTGAGNPPTASVLDARNSLGDLTMTINPNPSKGQAILRVSSPEEVQGRVVIFDLTGREISEVYRGAIAEGTATFELRTANLSSGVYSIRLLGEKMVLGESKLIIQK